MGYWRYYHHHHYYYYYLLLLLDIIAQHLERQKDGEGNKEFKSDRFLGTIIHGSLIGGIGSYIWYNKLDTFVSFFFKAGELSYFIIIIIIIIIIIFINILS